MNPLASCALMAVLGASACQGTATTSSATPDARTLAVARLDAYAQVARRIYADERSGIEVHASLKRISRDAAAMSGNRAELLRQLYLPHFHVVRLRWVKGGR